MIDYANFPATELATMVADLDPHQRQCLYDHGQSVCSRCFSTSSRVCPAVPRVRSRRYASCDVRRVDSWSFRKQHSLFLQRHVALEFCILNSQQNLLAIPISQYIGKRYTILFSMVLFMATNIWSSYSSTFNGLLASRIVGGLAAGIVEALGPMIVAECFPQTQLASAMVVYSLALGAGASLGPLIAGLVYNGTHNWPWLFKITAILIGVNLLSSILMLPETTPLKPHDETPPTSGSHEAVGEEKMAGLEVEHIRQIADPQEITGLYDIWIQRSFFLTLPDIKPESNFFILFLQPFSLMMSPILLLTSVTFGVLVAYTVITSVIYGTVLAMPPLLWTPLKVGLLNLSTLIGLLVGLPTGGYLADIFWRRSARRHDGVGLRESRLLALLPGAIISPLGLIVIGICLQNHLSWVGLAFGWMMSNVGLTAIANILLTYCVDCYPWRSAHIGVMVNVIKNVVSFGISYAVVPWYSAMGPEKQYGTMVGILVFFLLLNIPLYMYGRRLRTWSLNWVM